ncbi:unnamed protein product [Brassicogethes aeneus]|uniref:Ecdysone 20-monooxygenase n=1 Tax=Brassicogethes aeneus TaxID=1431903 RepID=A0A9P0FGW0_BRAAE|nr:unnamed protein product [Brassicogethes aeneus]
MFDNVLQSFDVVSLLIVAIFFLLVGYRPPWWIKKTAKYTSTNVSNIPGPLSLPILGTRWIFTFGGYSCGKIHEFYSDMYKKYGSVMKEEALFNVPVISVFEKQDIEKVLRSSGKYPIRPPTEAIAQIRRQRPERYASTGIVNEQGQTWHYLRTTLTSDLTSPKTISEFIPQIEAIADDWCNLLTQLKDTKGQIDDMHQVIGRLGLEVTCALVLGRRMGFLIPGQESDSAQILAKAVHDHFLAVRDTYFGLPFWKLFPTSAYKQLEQSEETIYKIAMELIETADDSTKESAIFQSVLRANVDSREKTAAIVDFIAAGIHTLKNSLLFLLYLVATNINSQKKILDDHSKNYLKACINESFRLLPTANCLARVTEEELTLSGHKVDAGSVLLCHTGIACRNENNFTNPNNFIPERWLDEQKSITSSNATFLVTPFGVGRRICPGKRLIEQVLPIIVDATVKKFHIKEVTALELQFEFLLSAKGPMAMIFEERR